MASKAYAEQDDASFWPALKVAVAAGRCISIGPHHVSPFLRVSVSKSNLRGVSSCTARVASELYVLLRLLSYYLVGIEYDSHHVCHTSYFIQNCLVPLTIIKRSRLSSCFVISIASPLLTKISCRRRWHSFRWNRRHYTFTYACFIRHCSEHPMGSSWWYILGYVVSLRTCQSTLMCVRSPNCFS
jgi:hypothetical protein